jgi:adenylylsulfate kinase-like enzyme
MNKIILINGPGGAGKTTASILLAKKFKRSAVIEADEIRLMIKSGYKSPFTKAGQAQLELSTKNACLLAKAFADEGFDVIIDDCTTGKKRLDLYYKTLKKYRFLIILLLPTRSIVKKRDGQRTGSAKLGKQGLTLYDKFIKRLPEEKRWVVLDNSNLTPAQTVLKMSRIIKLNLKKKA